MTPMATTSSQDIEARNEHRPVAAEREQHHAADREPSIGDDHQPFGTGQHTRIASPVGGELPDQGNDRVADQQHDADEMECFQTGVEHGGESED